MRVLILLLGLSACSTPMHPKDIPSDPDITEAYYQAHCTKDTRIRMDSCPFESRAKHYKPAPSTALPLGVQVQLLRDQIDSEHEYQDSMRQLDNEYYDNSLFNLQQHQKYGP